MPPLEIFGQPKRDQQPTPGKPSAELVATWATLHTSERRRLEFIAYLVRTGRINDKDDR